MIYLHETFEFHTASPKTLTQFITLVREQLLPVYEDHQARLMAAWICNAEALFKVNQIIEFDDPGRYLNFYHLTSESGKMREVDNRLFLLVRERYRDLYQSAGLIFTQAFHTAVQESRESPLKAYTIATLEINPDKWPGFVTRQEGGAAMGIPLIAFMKSITGKDNVIVDIWKGDLQSAGYQAQEFYDRLGFTEDWWQWIREVAPREKMVRAHMLPYSPLQ